MEKKDLNAKNTNGQPSRVITLCFTLPVPFCITKITAREVIIALRHLYVDPGRLPGYFIESLKKGKALREDADYYDDWSKTGAEETLKLAEEFLNKAGEIIKESASID